MEQEQKKEKPERKAEDRIAVWQSITVVMGILLIISIMTGGFWRNKTVCEKCPIIDPTAGIKPQQNVTISLEGAHMIGNKSAQVVIFEWSDFECPFCVKFEKESMFTLRTEYINTGKVLFIYKHYPLNNMHQNAQKAAEATECADEQAKFWEMHDLIYSTGTAGGIDALETYAKSLDLNELDFRECLSSGKYKAKIEQDTKEGAQIGINGTPSFVINGQLISGAQPYSVFKQIIEAELNKRV
jgi:protein-disulfide isomerase